MFETPPNLEGRVPIFISPRKRTAQLYPQALGSFSWPPTSRRAAVERFDLASTQDERLNFFLIIYEHSVRTSQETHYVSTTKPNRLMLFRETIAVYCENHTEYTDTLCVGRTQYI
jgi:hypothetical protein